MPLTILALINVTPGCEAKLIASLATLAEASRKGGRLHPIRHAPRQRGFVVHYVLRDLGDQGRSGWST